MATMMAAASVVSPYGLGKFSSHLVRQRSCHGRRAGWKCTAAVRDSMSPDSTCHHSAAAAPLGLHTFFKDAPKRSLNSADSWTERFSDTELGKLVAPIAASAGFYLQASASALAEVEVEDSPEEWIAVLVTAGVSAILYFLVIPAIVYNYLRLRWYKRNAAETIFQFLLVFIFFPGMLLLAPFINFRRLPKEGTEPP